MPKWLDRPIFDLTLWLYMGIILLVNIGFSYVPMIATPIGVFSPMAIVVGTVFVARDYAQRHVGHWVWLGMIAGTFFSYIFADPFVATASAAAFFVSEAVDWLIFTITKKPFGQRVLVSSAIATPVDTAVFLLGISAFGWGTFILMIISKMIASVVIWLLNKEPVLFSGAGTFQVPEGFALQGNMMMAELEGVGMRVEHLPDGSLSVFSNTDESRMAQKIAEGRGGGGGYGVRLDKDGKVIERLGGGGGGAYAGDAGGASSPVTFGTPGSGGAYAPGGAGGGNQSGRGGSAYARGSNSLAVGGKGGDGPNGEPGEPGAVARGTEPPAAA